MNDKKDEDPTSKDEVQIFENDETITVIIEDGGDSTVRPPRPILRKLGLEMQAKIAKWEAEQRERKAREGKTSEQ